MNKRKLYTIYIKRNVLHSHKKKMVSVWGFHHWIKGEVVWTCSLLYLWWWSNVSWKALLLHYPTGISPLIHRKRGTERDNGWMKKRRRRRSGVKGWWDGGRERCLSLGKGCAEECLLLHLRVATDRTCTHAWLTVISQRHIFTAAHIFFSYILATHWYRVLIRLWTHTQRIIQPRLTHANSWDTKNHLFDDWELVVATLSLCGEYELYCICLRTHTACVSHYRLREMFS